MDANQAAISHDAFDALLEASSLGAPRAKSVRQRTPAAVRDLLLTRLADRSPVPPDAAGQPVPPTQRVTQAGQTPLPRAGKGRDLPYALPGGSRSHSSTQFKRHSRTGKMVFAALHCNLYQAAAPEQNITELVDLLFGPVLLQGLFRRATETVAGASMETGLPAQLFFTEPGSRHSMVGRYGVGAKLALTSAPVPGDIWPFAVSPGVVLVNGKSLNPARYARGGADGPHAYGQSVFDDAWTRACSDVARHLAAALQETASPTGPGHWRIAWVGVPDPCARGMSTQTRQSVAPATRQVPGMAAQFRAQCGVCWPAADPAAAYTLQAAAFPRDSQGSSSRAGERSKGGGGRRWRDDLLAVYGQQAPGRAPAGRESEWEQLMSRLKRRTVASCGCPMVHRSWRATRASLEERWALERTRPEDSRLHTPGECCSTSHGLPGRAHAGIHDWLDSNAPWVEMSERLEEWTAFPPSLTPEPLWTSFLLQPGMTCCAGRTQEAPMGREDVRLLLSAESCWIDFPVASACSRTPYTVHAVFAGVPHAWTLSGLIRRRKGESFRRWNCARTFGGPADHC